MELKIKKNTGSLSDGFIRYQPIDNLIWPKKEVTNLSLFDLSNSKNWLNLFTMAKLALTDCTTDDIYYYPNR